LVDYGNKTVDYGNKTVANGGYRIYEYAGYVTICINCSVWFSDDVLIDVLDKTMGAIVIENSARTKK
jgi:hypothetical protein